MKLNHPSYEVVTRPRGPRNIKATDGQTKHFATKNLLEDDKKKIDKSINFLRGWEEKMVSIFCLSCCEKVEVSLGPNKAHSEIYT